MEVHKYIDKAQSFWENVLWTGEKELFGKSHQPCVHRCKQMKLTKKTLYLAFNQDGAFMFWGNRHMLHLAQGVLNLCRVLIWSLKMIKAFWREMRWPVSESLVSVSGHDPKNTEDYSDVSPDLNPVEQVQCLKCCFKRQENTKPQDSITMTGSSEVQLN